jgi:hypothetical protein
MIVLATGNADAKARGKLLLLVLRTAGRKRIPGLQGALTARQGRARTLPNNRSSRKVLRWPLTTDLLHLSSRR